jgi:hypothetical protein
MKRAVEKMVQTLAGRPGELLPGVVAELERIFERGSETGQQSFFVPGLCRSYRRRTLEPTGQNRKRRMDDDPSRRFDQAAVDVFLLPGRLEGQPMKRFPRHFLSAALHSCPVIHA